MVKESFTTASDTQSRQIDFAGEKFDIEAVWTVLDDFFPTAKARK